MSRYFITPRSAPEGEFNDPLLPHLSVADHVSADTGLVDKNGNPIRRSPNPIGFTAKL